MSFNPSELVGPVGNHYDKYGSRNPVTRELMRRFRTQVDGIVTELAPASLLDAGCGEGVLTESFAQLLPAARIVGIDVPSPELSAEWSLRRGPAFLPGSIYGLPFTDGEFELVSALEVMEHLERPGDALMELARVSSRHLLLSVPREPLWRILNVSSGRYLGALGNTPGHVQHWSRSSFREFASRVGTVRRCGGPSPWTVALVELD